MHTAQIIFRYTPIKKNGIWGLFSNIYRKLYKTNYDQVGRIIDGYVYGVEKDGLTHTPIEKWKYKYRNQKHVIKTVIVPYSESQFLKIFHTFKVYNNNVFHIFYILLLKYIFGLMGFKIKKYSVLLSSEFLAIACGHSNWCDYDIGKWEKYVENNEVKKRSLKNAR